MAAAYTPFVLLTAGYLLLRYAVFGQVARESMLGTARVDLFIQDVSTHLRRMVFGEPGLAMSAARRGRGRIGGAAVVHWRCLPAPALLVFCALQYFSIIWLFSELRRPLSRDTCRRDMYLASAVGRSHLESRSRCCGRRAARVMKSVAVAAAAVVLVGHIVRLADDIRLWETRSMVSRRAVADIEREALDAPQGR